MANLQHKEVSSFSIWRALWREEFRGLRRDFGAVAELIGFVILCLLVFSFASSGMNTPVPRPLVLWITILFGGMLYLGRSFDKEWAADGSRVLEGFRQLPRVLHMLFWVKLCRNILVLSIVTLVAAFLTSMTSQGGIPDWIKWSWVPLGLGVIGLSALGTLFSVGVLMQERREYLLPLLCYPLAIPLILGVSQCLSVGLMMNALHPAWTKLTAGCALLYVVVASLLFRHLVDE